MLSQTNLIISVIAILIPLTHGITCYVNNLQNHSNQCKYCAFANMTSYVTDWKPEITYNCLQDSEFSIEGIKSKAINKCQKFSAGGNLGYYLFMFVCDTDLCNNACDDAAGGATTSGSSNVGFHCLVLLLLRRTF